MGFEGQFGAEMGVGRHLENGESAIATSGDGVSTPLLSPCPSQGVRIRHFGFLANRWRASRLALGRDLLASASAESAQTFTVACESSTLWHCLRCGASMIVIQRPRQRLSPGRRSGS